MRNSTVFGRERSIPALAPPPEIIHIEDAEEYKRLYYERVLNKLDQKKVYNDLGENAVLLCYENGTM